MNVLISGGASYIGSWMVPQLLAEGHKITVYDTLMFGSGSLPTSNDSLKVVKADVRDSVSWASMCEGQDAVIYLASISRELMCQQQPDLAKSVNVDCFEPDVEIAKHKGVKRFIYASSVAVYGSSEKPMKEDSPLAPTTIYGQGKEACEKVLWKYGSEDFTVIATRSASVCGFAPRMRLDLTINRMVHDACRKGSITVEGGQQQRSHVHMKDLSDFYKLLLTARKELVEGQAFNVVRENQKIMDSALLVAKVLSDRVVEIHTVPRVDDRSYAVDGEKVKVLGWSPRKSIIEAITEVAIRFDAGYWKDSMTNPIYQNMA